MADESSRSAGPYPIEGAALVKTAALASVPAERLPGLLARVQADLGPRTEEYRRRYERIAAEPDRETFLVEPDHWKGVALAPTRPPSNAPGETTDGRSSRRRWRSGPAS